MNTESTSHPQQYRHVAKTHTYTPTLRGKPAAKHRDASYPLSSPSSVPCNIGVWGSPGEVGDGLGPQPPFERSLPLEPKSPEGQALPNSAPYPCTRNG